MLPDPITYLPHVLPWTGGGLAALGVPALIRELRRLIYARAASRLAQALIDNPDWSEERFNSVIRLVHDLDRNSAPRRGFFRTRSRASEAPSTRQS